MKTIELSPEMESKVTMWKVFAFGTTWVKYYGKKKFPTPESALREAKKEFPYDSEKNKLWVSGLTVYAETKPIKLKA